MCIYVCRYAMYIFYVYKCYTYIWLLILYPRFVDAKLHVTRIKYLDIWMVFDDCLDHMNYDQRCYHYSCCCPFFRMPVLYSRQTRCLSMPLNSICVWHCPRMVYLLYQTCLSCHWQSLLHSFPISSSTSKCRLR